MGCVPRRGVMSHATVEAPDVEDLLTSIDETVYTLVSSQPNAYHVTFHGGSYEVGTNALLKTDPFISRPCRV